MTCTLLALSLLAAPQTVARFRIVVDYDGTLDSEVRQELLRLTGEEFSSLLASQGLVTTEKSAVLFIHKAKTPYELHVEKSIGIVSSLPMGKLTRLDSLEPRTRELVEQHLKETFGSIETGSVPGEFEMKASAKYRLEVGGKVITIDQWLDDGGRPPFQNPSLDQNPAMVKKLAPSERKPQAAAGTLTLHAGLTRHNAESLQACVEFLATIAEKNARAKANLESAMMPVIAALGEKNQGLPEGDETLDQLSPTARERLKSSFLNSFRAYGYSSRDEAAKAWEGAVLVGGGVQFFLTYSVQNEDGSMSKRAVEVTRTGS
jgi:hypothetical protein